MLGFYKKEVETIIQESGRLMKLLFERDDNKIFSFIALYNNVFIKI